MFGINKISTDEVINRRLEEKVNKIIERARYHKRSTEEGIE